MPGSIFQDIAPTVWAAVIGAFVFMKRLIFVNRFFFPDHSATSQILGDLAFELARVGNDVHVITSQQRYDDPQARLPAAEIVQGVHIHRVSSTEFGRSAKPIRR